MWRLHEICEPNERRIIPTKVDSECMKKIKISDQKVIWTQLPRRDLSCLSSIVYRNQSMKHTARRNIELDPIRLLDTVIR
jgi:hypothetical protein